MYCNEPYLMFGFQVFPLKVLSLPADFSIFYVIYTSIIMISLLLGENVRWKCWEWKGYGCQTVLQIISRYHQAAETHSQCNRWGLGESGLRWWSMCSLFYVACMIWQIFFTYARLVLMHHLTDCGQLKLGNIWVIFPNFKRYCALQKIIIWSKVIKL